MSKVIHFPSLEKKLADRIKKLRAALLICGVGGSCECTEAQQAGIFPMCTRCVANAALKNDKESLYE